MGSYFPDQGLNPRPQVEAWSLNYWTTREVPEFLIVTDCHLTLNCFVWLMATVSDCTKTPNHDSSGPLCQVLPDMVTWPNPDLQAPVKRDVGVWERLLSPLKERDALGGTCHSHPLPRPPPTVSSLPCRLSCAV